MTVATDRVRSFFEMVSLAVANNRYPSEFSMELVLAICWEGSRFQNIEQGGRTGVDSAVGFGRIDRDGIRSANYLRTGRFPNDTEPYNRETILLDDAAAIAVIPDCLHAIRTIDRVESRDEVLATFACGDRTGPASRWKACETELKAVMQGFMFDPLKWDPLKIEAALRKARPFPTEGAEYLQIHDQLFPYVAVLGRLLRGAPRVEPGSHGKTVWAVQELMNRAAIGAPGSSSKPLLEVDGEFGPQTHSRVKEFQVKNGLVPDGVVGAATKSALAKISGRFAAFGGAIRTLAGRMV